MISLGSQTVPKNDPNYSMIGNRKKKENILDFN